MYTCVVCIGYFAFLSFLIHFLSQTKLRSFYTSTCESESGSVMSNSLRPHELYSSRNSPGQNAGVGSLSLRQGIFPNQGLNPGLLLCRRILYQLSYQGSPTLLVTFDTTCDLLLFICLNFASPGHCPRLTHMKLLILLNSWNNIPE